MRHALVDDATLEAAKRIEGKSITQNELGTAGDILALDNLIQAILYCDQIVYLDYEGRKSSGKLFDPFQRIMMDEKLYQKLVFLTNKMTDNYLPCIEGGGFTDEFFRFFFQALYMELRFTWEKKSGSCGLTPRIVRKRKDTEGLLYKKLLNILLEELRDKSFLDGIEHRIPLLYDSEGQIINNCYKVKDKDGREYPTKLSAQADSLFKALNYMIFRSNLHLIAANQLKADMILSPVRSLFQWGGFNRFYLGSSGPVPQLTAAIRWCDPHSTLLLRKLPLFSFWIAEHMGESGGFINNAYELREEKEFKAVRECLTEISKLADSEQAGSSKSMESAVSGLSAQFGKISGKYRLGSGRGAFTAPYALISIVSSSKSRLPHFDDITFDLKPGRSGAIYDDRKNFGIVFRSVLEDMIYMDTLSEYFDAVTSKVHYSAEAILQNIRIEPDRKAGGQHGRTVPV